MSQIDDYIDKGLSGEDDEEPVLDAPEADAPVDDAPEAEDRPAWLPEKFQSPEALAKAYDDLQREFHRRNQQPAAPEPEPEDDGYDEAQYAPTFAMPLSGPPQTMEQFDAWLSDQPAQAAMWAITNTQDPDLQQHAMNTWAALDGIGFTNFAIQAALQQNNAQWDDRIKALEQRFQPHDQAYQQQVAATTAQMVAQRIPEWEQVKGNVTATITQNPALKYAWDNAKTPAEFADVAYQAYGWLQWQAQQQQAAQQPTTGNQPAPPRAATRTRQSAASVATDDDEAASILAGANRIVGRYRE